MFVNDCIRGDLSVVVFWLGQKKKNECVSSDMSKNIRVGRLKKKFLKEVIAKLFSQLNLLLLHPNNSNNSTNTKNVGNRYGLWGILCYTGHKTESLSKR